jgi:tetratricopeptide (TPR) repeat protein
MTAASMPSVAVMASNSVTWVAVIGAASITAVASIAAAFIARRRPDGPGTGDVVPTGAVAAAQLPPRPRFVNRQDELTRAVTSIQAGGGVLTIEGEIGVGKSAVAAELFHRLHADAERLALSEHSFLWIDARHGCPSLVDICRHLSLATDHLSLSTVAEDFKLEVLRRHLADRKTVLGLDNLGLADDPSSVALQELLRAVPSGSFVIASLNRPGALQASRVHLDSLKPRHVREFIAQQVEALGLEHAHRFDESFARRVHAAVGGNPFMIAWFLRSLVGTPESLEERLTALEQGEGPSELLARVWVELSERSRTVLAACAHLCGYATIEQLEVGCDLPKDAVLAELRELIGRGLVVTSTSGGSHPNTHACTEGLQRFVRAQVQRADSSALTLRLAAYYTHHFEGSWEDARWAIPHVGAIRIVLDQLFERGHDKELQRLFRTVLDIFMTLGLFDDRITYGGLAYQSAVRSADHVGASLACSVVSSTHAIRGEWREAKAALALGLVAAETSGSSAERARQMREEGFLSYRSGDPRRALEVVEGADEMAREAGDLNNAVDVTGLRMSAHLYLGDVDAAEDAAIAYTALCEQIPWERAKSNPLRHRAEIAIHRGDLREARELLDHARSIAVAYEDRRALPRLNMTEARLLLVERRPRPAMRAASGAARAARELGLPAEEVEALALRRTALRALAFPPLRYRHARKRPVRFSNAPVGGD